jgi:putative ATPase
LADYVGQRHLLEREKPLARAIAGDRLHSMVVWGPPGVGKTTLARVIAGATRARFVSFSAVLGNLAELRKLIDEAQESLRFRGERTLLFVDEIHRFNKGQQDAFLPHVESGAITLFGATTENPSFALTPALLSRCRVYRLEPLAVADLRDLLGRAIADPRAHVGSLTFDDGALELMATAAQGDARRALALLEASAAYAAAVGASSVSVETVRAAEGTRALVYDRSGEEHYNLSSAFIKSMRGSDPDAAIYWLMRMLEAGEDPLYLSRRMIIFASEDIGNADARALLVATAADDAFRRLGMPEGIYPLAHAALYLASTPKSNACTLAWQRAKALVDEHGALPVPLHLRNGHTTSTKSAGYGDGYRYPHDEPDGVARGETYLPQTLLTARFYDPVERGEEVRIKARLAFLRGETKP